VNSLKNKFNYIFNAFKKKGGQTHEQADRNLVYSLAPKKIPSLRQLKYLPKILTSKENLWLKILGGIILINVIFFGVKFYSDHLQVSPAYGGQYIEGMIGAPKYINPLYNYNRDIDSDLSALIFSSLFKRDAVGHLENDLVDSWSISEDSRAYSFIIKDNVRFHNGNKLTADDIVFTFSAIKNEEYGSPLKSMFFGADVEKVDDRTVKFVLSEPYAAFPELLTFGILPQSLWQNIDPQTANLAELNAKPIGSGPYIFRSLVKNKSGEIKEYILEANDDYYSAHPYIDRLIFKFYPNSNENIAALNNNDVDGLSYLELESEKDVLAKNSLNFNRLNLPQTAGLFINKKNNVALSDVALRQALALSLDKNKIVSDVWSDNATVIDGPILPSSFAYNPNLKKYNFNLAEANKLLDDAGWKKINISDNDIKAVNASSTEGDLVLKKEIIDYAGSDFNVSGDWRYKPTKKGTPTQFLSLTLTIVDAGANSKMAEEIKMAWAAIGIKAKVRTVLPNQVQGDVIRTRNFEVLLFNQMVGVDPDQYAFWHSSQTSEGGLNITEYKNKEIDSLLETGRLTTNKDERLQKYQKFQEIITTDLPVIFLYSPKYLYLQSKKINGFTIKDVTVPSDRFYDAAKWYIKTEKKLVW
jgi:peptide/nickel transport system substrate-binding protein